MVPTGLRLPDQEEFQLFTSDHSFERYDLRFKELFGFERAVKRDIRFLDPISTWCMLIHVSSHHLLSVIQHADAPAVRVGRGGRRQRRLPGPGRQGPRGGRRGLRPLLVRGAALDALLLQGAQKVSRALDVIWLGYLNTP